MHASSLLVYGYTQPALDMDESLVCSPGWKVIDLSHGVKHKAVCTKSGWRTLPSQTMVLIPSSQANIGCLQLATVLQPSASG
jgi:hypothetical protein